MQSRFVENFEKMIHQGKTRGLLISATGTGKTYASVFALRQVKAKKVLFLAHRTQLLGQAMQSYRGSWISESDSAC